MSWAFRYRFLGISRKITFDGDYPTIGLAAARALLAKAKALLADGIDPGEEKRAAKVSAKARPRRRILSRRSPRPSLSTRRATRRRSWMETERILKHDILPAWGKRRLSTNTKAATYALLDPIAERAPILANRRWRLEVDGPFCLRARDLEVNPFAGLRPPRLRNA